MKKYFLRICSMLLILSITASLMGCSNVYYERKECSQHINEFMDCVFRRDAETLSTMAYMDSIDLQMINYYKTDAFMSKAIEKASYEVYMDNVRQFNQKIYFDVFIMLPDYTTAYRSAPSFGDLDYYCQAIDNQSKKQYKVKEVTVIYSVQYNIWIVNNLKELIKDFFEPMFEVVSEGRSNIALNEEYQASAEDAKALYRHSFLTDVNFQHAVITARREETGINRIEGDDLKAIGLDGQNVRYVLDSLKGSSPVTFTLYHFESAEDAKKFFENHSDPNQTQINYYYKSEVWGYSRDMTFDGINMYYWNKEIVLYAELPRAAMENPDIYKEYSDFWVDLDVMG